ncbi:MAG: PHP domain-containing protein [Chloroflexi bacterium AL-W]|nr:PHP domain-containing protein [Chloroflexi bacterium AL-N1]NOK71219.1 PHP domain-containing protein [Chloroflexi bacterium AL-N10]NOK76508.1 PHP domain-containing protein [Chloroflexi bacterium AL-N5]NOK83625.1 PHP domain-containing protein [Chloroflexi bacterium AL-W]NOK92253.1 PHP domain-containing protein [Chloroflexi bacterium AL-N15]
MHYYPGALHMHTTYSDGSGTIDHVIRSARDAGLRWIIVTDHDTLEGRPYQGWRDDVLVIVGYEITPDRNHFLTLNVDQIVDRKLPPQDFVDAVYDHGGFGIIAHPDERVQNSFKDIYRWDDWSVDGPRERSGRSVGIELWNFMSDWGEHLTQRNKEFIYFFPRQGLNGPTPETLAWWDRLNVAGRRTFGVGGVDAHAFKQRAPWGEIEVFGYKWIFETLTNYLLLPEPLALDPDTARHQVFGALAAGRSYFVNRMDGDCPSLTFAATSDDSTWHIGDSVSLQNGPLTLIADVDLDAEVQIIRNGRVFAKGLREVRQTITRSGVYRLEGYRKGRPWLYTNPIYVVE